MTNWTPEQQKEHRKLWVEALRSGKYQQARNALRRNDTTFCCLGVACEISGLGVWDGSSYVVGDESGVNYLPPSVIEWLGVSGFNPRFEQGRKKTTSWLAYANDQEGKTFAQIADIIEREPPGLIANV